MFWQYLFISTIIVWNVFAVPLPNQFERIKRQSDSDAIVFWDDDDLSNRLSNSRQNNQNQNNNPNSSNGWGDFRPNDNPWESNVPQQQFTTPGSISSTIAVPGMGTTQSACEDACRTTSQYNPVCGDDGRTYTNPNRLKCAQRCGKRVQVRHIGACPRT